MMDLANTSLSLPSLLTTGAVGIWFWYDKKVKDKKLEELDKAVNSLNTQQVKHESIFVTEDHVRNIVKAEIAPLKDDMKEVKETQKETNKSINQLVTELNSLMVEIRVENALKNKIKDENS